MTSRARASSDGTSSERGRQERGEDAPEEEIFHRVIDALFQAFIRLPSSRT